MTSLAIGVDNIHTMLSQPEICACFRDYSLNLPPATAGSFISGVELRNAKTIDGADSVSCLRTCCNRR